MYECNPLVGTRENKSYGRQVVVTSHIDASQVGGDEQLSNQPETFQIESVHVQ